MAGSRIGNMEHQSNDDVWKVSKVAKWRRNLLRLSEIDAGFSNHRAACNEPRHFPSTAYIVTNAANYCSSLSASAVSR